MHGWPLRGNFDYQEGRADAARLQDVSTSQVDPGGLELTAEDDGEAPGTKQLRGVTTKGVRCRVVAEDPSKRFDSRRLHAER